MRGVAAAVTAVIVLTLGACGGGGCAGLADEGVELAQRNAVALGQMPFEDALAGEEIELPPELEAELDAFAARVDESGCSRSDMIPLYRERADQLEGTGFFIGIFRERFRGGNIGRYGGNDQ